MEFMEMRNGIRVFLRPHMNHYKPVLNLGISAECASIVVFE